MVARAALVALLLSFSAPSFAAIKLAGADQHSLSLSRPATRIVTLAPDLTELVFDAGAGDALVGVSAYSDYPAAARRLPRIGDAFRFDLERIVALRPDLILAWRGGTSVPMIARLRALKLPVLVIGTRTFNDIAANLELIGRASGHERQARDAAQAFLAGLQKLRSTYSNGRPVRVFYEISNQPLYTVGGRQVISRMIDLCGGHNIYHALKPLAAAVSLETTLARDPQAIVTGGDPGAGARLRAWRRWPELSAVKTGSLFSIDGDLLARATSRMLEGGQELCRDLAVTRKRLKQ